MIPVYHVAACEGAGIFCKKHGCYLGAPCLQREIIFKEKGSHEMKISLGHGAIGPPGSAKGDATGTCEQVLPTLDHNFHQIWRTKGSSPHKAAVKKRKIKKRAGGRKFVRR